MLRFLLTGVVLLMSFAAARAAEPRFEVSFSFSRTLDNGDNPGTLFEVRDSDGQTIAGAGYLGAYNTFPRSDREELQVYLRHENVEADWKVEVLPRIDSQATGFYPFQLAGELYVAPRNGTDSRVHRWDQLGREWQPAPEIRNGTERIAGKYFHVAPDEVTYDGQVLLTPEDSFRFGEHYFANGLLVLRCFRSDASSPANLFQVYEWDPAEKSVPHLISKYALNLPQPREFVYTFGEWSGEIVAVTNMGGVYRLRPQGWDTLRVPDPNVSYQIYCGLNYRNMLLLGHYPTGELYEYTGDQLVHKKGWPPVLSGVSERAREAQTLAIYNGDLYGGVWPWGELWRFDGRDWKFVQRMFKHPEITESVTHPYELETKAVDSVYNLWGQRVTGLIPSRGALFITTSSKGGSPWDQKFAFLSPEQQADYGAIYRATLPGQTSFHLPPPSTPVRFEAVVEDSIFTIKIDGETRATLSVPSEILDRLLTGTTTVAKGIYGPSPLQFEEIRLSHPASRD